MIIYYNLFHQELILILVKIIYLFADKSKQKELHIFMKICVGLCFTCACGLNIAKRNKQSDRKFICLLEFLWISKEMRMIQPLYFSISAADSIFKPIRQFRSVVRIKLMTSSFNDLLEN